MPESIHLIGLTEFLSHAASIQVQSMEYLLDISLLERPDHAMRRNLRTFCELWNYQSLRLETLCSLAKDFHTGKLSISTPRPFLSFASFCEQNYEA